MPTLKEFLRSEVKPALGCTEPGAVARAGAPRRPPPRLALPGAPVLPLLGEGAVHALDLPVLPGL